MQEVQALQLTNMSMCLGKPDSLFRDPVTLFPPPVREKFTAYFMQPIHITGNQFSVFSLQAVSLYNRGKEL